MTSLTMLFAVLRLGLAEIIIFQLGAIIFGFSIHFFWKSRLIKLPAQVNTNEADNWRVKYFQEFDQKEQLVQQLDVCRAERDSFELEVTALEEKLEELNNEPPIQSVQVAKNDYLGQLSAAQTKMREQSEMIQNSLQKIHSIKSAESELLGAKKLNDDFRNELISLKGDLEEKERVISDLQNQVILCAELKARLENTYNEFYQLQDKLFKVQSQLTSPSNKNYDYDELQQSYFRLTKECDEIKAKNLFLFEENQKLLRFLSDSEAKLREASFQRQQLSRKVSYLEELSGDLNHLSGHQKLLEGQMKRIGELGRLFTTANETTEE